MKIFSQQLAIAILLMMTSVAFGQNVIIVDNRPSAAGGTQSDLNAAITGATPGDIIHVLPSPVSYGTINITQSITLFGIGFNPDKDQPELTRLDNFTINVGVNDVRISGFYVSNAIVIGNGISGTIANVVIENCDVDEILGNIATGSASNIIIRNNIIGQRETSTKAIISFDFAEFSSVTITNNIIVGSSSSNVTYGSLEIAGGQIVHNLFLGNGGNPSKAFNNIENCIVSDNIFFGRSPQGVSVMGTTFTNNITFSTFNDVIPFGTNGNSKSGNFESTDPLLTNISTAADWDFSFDPTPTGGPAIAGGLDGTDIGVTGGSIPFDQFGVPLPLIQKFLVPSINKEGDDLSVEIEARGNN